MASASQHSSATLVAIGIGNTHTQVALFSGDKLAAKFRLLTAALLASESLPELERNLPKFFPAGRIALCSVVPAATARLKSVLKKMFPHLVRLDAPLEISAALHLPFKIKYRPPETLGSDRIALAAAARRRFPDAAVIAIDFGTATTYNVITSHGHYLGGLILSGIGLSAAALHERTAQLPVPRLKKTSRLIGRSTAEGLSSGLYFGAAAQTAGLIDKLKTELRATHAEKKIYVLATGGDAELLARAVHFDAIDPDAVLKGIASLAAMNP